MEEILTQEQPTFKTMFAQLNSLEEYTALNNAIGTAKSYPDERSDTLNYSDPNPSKINDLYFMEITAEVQERFPQVLDSIELIKRKPDDNSQDEEITAEGI